MLICCRVQLCPYLCGGEEDGLGAAAAGGRKEKRAACRLSQDEGRSLSHQGLGRGHDGKAGG